MTHDYIALQRDMADRDAEDRQRDLLELDAELYAELYANDHCTNDKDILSRWLVEHANEAFRYMEIAKQENLGEPDGLFELLEAAYWMKLYIEKLKEIESAE